MEIARRLSSMLVEKLALSEEFIDLFTFLYRAIEEGHLTVKISTKQLSPPLIQAFPDLTKEELNRLKLSILNAFHSIPLEKVKDWIYVENSYLMLRSHYLLQRSIQSRMESLAHRKFLPIPGEIELDTEKKKGLEIFKKNSLFLLSGLPGSGKTWLAGQMVLLLAKEQPIFVYLLAPTGLAAALLNLSIQKTIPPHLKKQIKIKAGTLQRHLPKEPKRIKIYADLVIVDEASMIDAALFNQLLLSIGPQTRVVIMGDPMQLPSIEFGSIFNDLIHKFSNNHLHLNRVYRQEGKQIVAFAKAIWELNEKEYLSFLDGSKKAEDVIFKEECDPIQDYASHLPTHFKNAHEAFITLHQSKILSSGKEGFFGVTQINQRMFNTFCQTAQEEIFLPILVTKNQPNSDLYNGDLGVLKIKKSQGYSLIEASAYFWSYQKQELIKRPAHEVQRFELAFAMTIHKSQGSEFNYVYLIVTDRTKCFGRQVLYTAVTRTKKKLFLFGSFESYRTTFQTNIFRQSLLNPNIVQDIH